MQLILCGGGSGEQNTLANQKLNEIIDYVRALLYFQLRYKKETILIVKYLKSLLF